MKTSVCNSKSLTIDEINQAGILWILSSQKILIGKTKQLKKLYPIEVKSVENVSESDINGIDDAVDIENNENNENDKPRPRHVAADNSILIRRIMRQV